MKRSCIFVLIISTFSLTLAANANSANEIFDATGIKGGLVVHLGCGDGTLTAELRTGANYIVQGLDTSTVNVEKARGHIQSLGLYGVVSANRFDGKRLPYADNLVNLVVAEDRGRVQIEEIMRVLAPKGAAYIKSGSKWTTRIKPESKDTDEWTHFLHGPGNNAVAKDSKVGPPRRLQWSAGPQWARSHQFISSLVALVSGGGRIFYVMDETTFETANILVPDKWSLIARDAYNGVLLWKIPLPQWRGEEWGNISMRGRPPSAPRRVVVGEKYLYATFSHNGPINIIDPATGKIIKSIPGSENSQEILFSDNIIVASLLPLDRKASGSIAAFDADTGKKLWEKQDGGFRSQSLAGLNGRVIYDNNNEIVCLDMKKGTELWKNPVFAVKGEKKGKVGKGETYILQGDFVVVTGGGAVFTLSAKTGKLLWEKATGGRSMRSGDMFIAQGKVWRAGNDHNIIGYDVETGNASKTIDPTSAQSWGHHLRCYRSKATENYLITQVRGTEFISLNDDNHSQNDWVRGPCRYGVMPANGCLYIPPHQCFCYGGATFSGFNAFTTAKPDELKALSKISNQGRLIKGQAYGKKITNVEKNIWPTLRHDARRTGATTAKVSSRLEEAWKVRLGKRLTQPVLSSSTIYIADRDSHTLFALNSKTGKEQWHYIGGGRIDSPPTLYKGRLLFGTADGMVNCLNSKNGKVIWQFHAAPHSRMIVNRNNVESVWRVHGSVLIENDIAYVSAGRSSFLDSGIYLWALDPVTGKILHQNRLDTMSPTRSDAEGKPFITPFHIEGTVSDILVAQGGYIYMGQMKFDRNLKRIETPYIVPDEKNPVVGMDLEKEPYVHIFDNEKFKNKVFNEIDRGHMGDHKMGLHLFTKSSFLDDSHHERTYWMYSETWPGFQFANLAAKAGQMLVVGPKKTYGVQAYTGKDGHSPWFVPGEKGFLLFADRNDNEPVLDHRARNLDKGLGFTRAKGPEWFQYIPVRVNAMVLAGNTLFVAGPPDVLPEDDPHAAYEGREGGLLWAFSADKGEKLAEYKLEQDLIFDSLIAGEGKLFFATRDGSLVCYQNK